MAKNTTTVQPNATDLQSIDFTSQVTHAVTQAIGQAVANYITDSGHVSDAINAVIARHRANAIAAAAYAESTRE